MEKRKVILDVDTGSDDAIALIAAMANPAFEVLGIMAVNGNRAVEITTENSLRISELMGGTVPVFRGCALPWTSCMLGFRRHYPMYQAPEESLYKNIHGTYIDQCPPASIQAQPQNAVSWLVETLMAAEDGEITLIPLGPLTNIAHAVRIEPRIIPKIREIVYMGGGFRVGNKSALAEFNVWLDPEAAQAVLDCGIPFTFVTLDATHSAYVTLEDAARFRAIGTRPAQVVADLCEQRIAGYGEWQKVADVPAAPVHDPLTVAYLVDPSVITELVDAPCVVDCGRGARLRCDAVRYQERPAGGPGAQLQGGALRRPAEVCGYSLPAAGAHPVNGTGCSQKNTGDTVRRGRVPLFLRKKGEDAAETGWNFLPRMVLL